MRKLSLLITNERSNFVACSSVMSFSSAPISAAASLINPIRSFMMNHLAHTNNTSRARVVDVVNYRLLFLPLRPKMREKKPRFLLIGRLCGALRDSVVVDQVALTARSGTEPVAAVADEAGAISIPVA